ncbi:polysaccharide deacetylase [Actinoplanes awajinensis subsp. mycoplanecinus]|uniref:Polysaccharide deacetylase n=2 Tax=Actinoplanes awajinensis TaxID=135946 RepID=A0A101JB23_9ACTN|nr:polysaccharide deacetylase [Actinoplanes awajinensis subsp. mycoplanecinus]
MYHSVQAYHDDPYQVTVRPDRFEHQLRWLHRHGRRGVSMRELLRRRRSGHDARLVGLTFDDGYADFVTEALPALVRHGFTATVFVVAGALGGWNTWDDPGPRKRLLTATQVRQVAAAGMEIGSHGLHHVHLPGLGPTELAEHLLRSRGALSALAGGPVTGFCYPYGDAGPRETAAVAAAGYEYACAAGRELPAGPLTLPRTFVGDRDTPPRLYAKLARHRLTTGRVPV